MSEHIKKETGTQTIPDKNNDAVQLGNAHGESGLPTMVRTTLESIPTYSSFKIRKPTAFQFPSDVLKEHLFLLCGCPCSNHIKVSGS